MSGAQLRRHFWELSQSFKCSFKLMVTWITSAAVSQFWRKETLERKHRFESQDFRTHEARHTQLKWGKVLLWEQTTYSAPLQSSAFRERWVFPRVPTGLASLKPVLVESAFRFALGTQWVCLLTFSGRNLALTLFSLSPSFIIQNLWLLMNKGEYIYNCIQFMRCV